MWSIIEKLLDTSDFPARWYCGNWSSAHGWIHIIADSLIWASYMAIPVLLCYFLIKRRRYIPFTTTFVLFCAFIFFCGTTHLIEASIFWYPWYRFSALAKALTAAVSVATVIVLVPVIPRALALRTPHELEEEIEKRKKVEEDLRKANEKLETFNYSVSHDLKAPLRALSYYADVLQKDYSSRLDEQGQKATARISKNAGKMTELINDLLTLSKLSLQRENLRRVNMQNLFLCAYQELEEEEEKKKRDITFDVGELREAWGDKVMLQQMVNNLVSNALKYTQPREKTVIEVAGQEIDGEYVYSIRDNGVGFDDQYQDKVFGAFKRLHSDKEFAGTGVGLAIVKKAVEFHDGQIWAKSQCGKGSTFYFTLKRIPDQLSLEP